MLAIYWARVCKISCWNKIDLDYVLDLGDNLFKCLGSKRYLDLSSLPNKIIIEGANNRINKFNFHGRRVNFEKGSRINGQKGTNLEHSFQNIKITIYKKSSYLLSYIYIIYVLYIYYYYCYSTNIYIYIYIYICNIYMKLRLLVLMYCLCMNK